MTSDAPRSRDARVYTDVPLDMLNHSKCAARVDDGAQGFRCQWIRVTEESADGLARSGKCAVTCIVVAGTELFFISWPVLASGTYLRQHLANLIYCVGGWQRSIA